MNKEIRPPQIEEIIIEAAMIITIQLKLIAGDATAKKDKEQDAIHHTTGIEISPA